MNYNFSPPLSLSLPFFDFPHQKFCPLIWSCSFSLGFVRYSCAAAKSLALAFLSPVGHITAIKSHTDPHASTTKQDLPQPATCGKQLFSTHQRTPHGAAWNSFEFVVNVVDPASELCRSLCSTLTYHSHICSIRANIITCFWPAKRTCWPVSTPADFTMDTVGCFHVLSMTGRIKVPAFRVHDRHHRSLDDASCPEEFFAYSDYP